MIVLDTNLLIYAHRSATAEHEGAKRAILRACEAGACGISLPSITEFWSIVTHPKSLGRPSTGQEASAFIDVLVNQGGVKILMPGLDFSKRLMQLAADLKIGGVRIFDLQIALIAFENGAVEIWSHDRNFICPPGLRLIDPLE